MEEFHVGDATSVSYYYTQKKLFHYRLFLQLRQYFKPYSFDHFSISKHDECKEPEVFREYLKDPLAQKREDRIRMCELMYRSQT